MEFEGIVAIYRSIRSQSLTSKEQRFRLYYWKLLVIIVLLGFSISNNSLSSGIDEGFKCGLIASIMPLLTFLFDLNIYSRSEAIKRDGMVLKLLEDEIASKNKINKENLPERFYDSHRVKYETSSNRFPEIISQFLVSIFAIVSSCLVAYRVSGLSSLVLYVICSGVVVAYLAYSIILIKKNTKE